MSIKIILCAIFLQKSSTRNFFSFFLTFSYMYSHESFEFPFIFHFHSFTNIFKPNFFLISKNWQNVFLAFKIYLNFQNFPFSVCVHIIFRSLSNRRVKICNSYYAKWKSSCVMNEIKQMNFQFSSNFNFSLISWTKTFKTFSSNDLISEFFSF